MGISASWKKYTLDFKRSAGTSRGIMHERHVWFIFLQSGTKIGMGECAPLPGLSRDNFNQIEKTLSQVCSAPESYLGDPSLIKNFPAIRFALEMAYMDFLNGGIRSLYPSPFTNSRKSININGLIWMGDPESMSAQIDQKLEEGWQCIKIKIGALDFETELELLRSIRKRFGADRIELRVDANGAFSKTDVHMKLNHLAAFDLHSIEQPIKPDQWELLAELSATSSVPIALDEELIGLREESDRIEMLNIVKPQFIVLKPSLLGGFRECEKWIELANQRNIGWWVTSALESNIGLNALAQWVATLDTNGYQGLGTGQLFTNNVPSPLKVKRGELYLDSTSAWNEVNQFIGEWLSPAETMELETSGSTGKSKTISVRKEWMERSARLTGKTFKLKRGDTALLCLPMRYVAGKMMVVRSMVLGLDLLVSESSTDPLEGVDLRIDFTAMVPLQLQKSLEMGRLGSVKMVIVGGGQVSYKLEKEVQDISTQVVETYGMTETLTHVAVRWLNGPHRTEHFLALDGIAFETDDRDCLVIKAPSLNPNPFVTNDIVKLIDEKSFQWLGRIDNVINSGGVKIFPEVVEAKLAFSITDRRFFITGLPDEKLGQKVVLVVEGEAFRIPDDAWSKFEQYEKPREILFKMCFSLTKTGKINRNESIQKIEF